MKPQPHRPQRRRLAIVVIAMILGASAAIGPTGAQESVEEARKEREEYRADRAAALRELEAAKLKDAELAGLIDWLNAEIATTELAVSRLRADLRAVETELAAARQRREAAEAESQDLRDEIATLAVAGFVHGTQKEEAFFRSGSLSAAYRQDSLIREANAEPAELLDRMRVVEEEGLIAEREIADGAAATITLERQLAGELANLESGRSESNELKLEYERRVEEYAGQVAEYEAEIQDLTEFIVANTPPSTTGATTPPPPSDPSVQGYNWPITGRVGSGFGPRVHPIFGYRRMHTGLDIGAPSGQPIYASKGGTVIFAGWRNGYGNTVIVDHGGGFTSLYAHQSKVGSSVGQEVLIGDVIGYVGSTGWSTSPHLHFEIRLNGNPIDPLPYLP